MDEKKRLKRLQEKKLTRKQQKFVKEIVSNDGLITAREAAIRAGFPASSAHTRAWEMQNPNICPHVVATNAMFETCKNSVTKPSKMGRGQQQSKPKDCGAWRRETSM